MATTLTLYWSDATTGTTPPPGAPWDGTTLLFTDFATGDITTGQTGPQSSTYVGDCALRSTPTAYISGGAVFTCPVVLTSLRFNYQVDYDSVLPLLCSQATKPDPAGPSYSLFGQYSADGVSWTAFTGSLTDYGTYAEATLPSVTIRYVVVRVTADWELYDGNNTITTTPRISDFRLTYTETPPAGTPTIAAMGACAGAQNNLSWSAVTCADSYDIERGGVTIQTAYAGTSYADAPVTIGTPYSYRVRARNTGGTGPWSSAVIYTPCNTVVPPTGDPTETDVGAACEGRQVTWWIAVPVTGATSYTVRLYGPGLPSTGQVIYIGEFVNESEPMVYQPLLYTEYSFTVQASNGVGTAAEGAHFYFTPCESGCACTVYTRQDC